MRLRTHFSQGKPNFLYLKISKFEILKNDVQNGLKSIRSSTMIMFRQQSDI